MEVWADATPLWSICMPVKRSCRPPQEETGWKRQGNKEVYQNVD